jgi:hypothetical protein
MSHGNFLAATIHSGINYQICGRDAYLAIGKRLPDSVRIF